jgi:4-amino-4-deoxy-L-arabinose transferase-like glycosyltransferase
VRKVVVAVLVLCVLNFLIRLPWANMPAIEDEGAYFAGMRAVAQDGLNPFVNFWGYKPPVMFELPALVMSLWGWSRVWARLYMYALSSFTLWYIFLLGKKTIGEKGALIVVIMTMLYPMFIVQTMLYMDAIPVCLFIMMVLYYYYSDNILKLAVSSILW